MKNIRFILLCCILQISTTSFFINQKTSTKNECIENVDIDYGYPISTYSKFKSYSFDEKQKGVSCFSGNASLDQFYSIEKMGSENLNRISSKDICIKVESINSLGLMTVNLDVVDSKSDAEEDNFSEQFYAFSTFNQNSERDVILDLYGNRINAIDVLTMSEEEFVQAYPIAIEEDNNNENENIPASSLGGSTGFIRKPITDLIYSTDVLYPLAQITLTLSNYSDASSLASTIMKAPTLSLTDPAPYLFYLAKVELAKKHYDYNSSLPQPATIINNQGDYELWKFGFSEKSMFDLEGCNIKSKGCGIIAAYNALVRSGAQPDFPSLIALYELSGADLLFGYVGINPIPDYLTNIVIPNLTASLKLTYNTLLRPALNKALNLIEPLLYALCTFTPADLILPGSSLTVAVVAMTTLRVLINNTVKAVTDFLNWYGTDFTTSEKDILELVFGQSIFDVGNLSSFENELSKKRQAIICYWNSVNDDSSININDGAHYVYIEGELNKGHLVFKDYNGCRRSNISYNNIEQFFGGTKNKCQFIWGYII